MHGWLGSFIATVIIFGIAITAFAIPIVLLIMFLER